MERTMASSLELPRSLVQFLADADRIAAPLVAEVRRPENCTKVAAWS